jgi:hypothetical protein
MRVKSKTQISSEFIAHPPYQIIFAVWETTETNDSLEKESE